ncbi:DUF2807 domain-containing protein [Solirubrobacter taibaiensis]|nr:DUF2807 domain-containing protein [Solirubrobacter taibaiensis]
MRFLLLLPALALPLAACGDDGPQTSQTRDVAAFTQVVNDTSVNVRLHVGGPQRIQVRAGENVIDDVRTDVEDGVLRVDFEHRGWGGDDVEVEAWTPSLDAIRSEEADGVVARAFTVRTDGSGGVRVHGKADTLELRSDGSGDAELAAFTARAALVNATGSGNVDIRAAERLDVKMDGSGDVRYHGEPRLTQQDDGSGEVERAN